ncbi:MAG: YjbE family putative metal transport protein [Bacillota bacterium]
MNDLLTFIFAALQITLLDLVLSGDNVGVIALAIRNLNPKDAKKASVIGVTCAVCLRILFASVITIIMGIEWLPIKLIGGILLLKITWNLINDNSDDEGSIRIKNTNKFGKAVLSIIIADVSMSLDNVLAIGGSADGHVGLIVFGILLNIPILLLGSQYVAKIMKTYRIAIYIGASILVHTSLSMILEDKLVSQYVNHLFVIISSWSVAAFVIVLGLFKMRKSFLSSKADT